MHRPVSTRPFRPDENTLVASSIFPASAGKVPVVPMPCMHAYIHAHMHSVRAGSRSDRVPVGDSVCVPVRVPVTHHSWPCPCAQHNLCLCTKMHTACCIGPRDTWLLPVHAFRNWANNRNTRSSKVKACQEELMHLNQPSNSSTGISESTQVGLRSCFFTASA